MSTHQHQQTSQCDCHSNYMQNGGKSSDVESKTYLDQNGGAITDNLAYFIQLGISIFAAYLNWSCKIGRAPV